VERGEAAGSLRHTDVKKPEVEVGGRRHVVDVLGGRAQLERNGEKLMRIKIAGEADGVRCGYKIAFGTYGETTQLRASPWRGPTPPAAGKQTPRGSPLS
jgi:hypothetical protein